MLSSFDPRKSHTAGAVVTSHSATAGPTTGGIARTWEPGVLHTTSLYRSPHGFGLKLEEGHEGAVFVIGTSTGTFVFF